MTLEWPTSIRKDHIYFLIVRKNNENNNVSLQVQHFDKKKLNRVLSINRAVEQRSKNCLRKSLSVQPLWRAIWHHVVK